MDFGDMTPKEFGDTFFGREDERKEQCIHCGKIWYSIHHKDGVCHSCQQKGLPGRTNINKGSRLVNVFGVSVLIAIMLLFAVIFHYLGSH
jgi:hypothetical protein